MRAEPSRLLAERAIGNVRMVAGEVHTLAIDDGSHSDYSGTGGAGSPVRTQARSTLPEASTAVHTAESA